VRRTTTCGRAAPVVACGEGEVDEACNAPRFLEQQRGGPRGHRSRRIDEEFPRWHCSPRWGQLENVVVSVGLNGKGVALGHGGGHPPRSGSSAGRLVRCGGRSVRAHVGRLWRRKADRARLDRAQKQNNRRGPVRVTPRGGRGERGPASRQLHGSDRDGHRLGGVRRRAGAGERAVRVGRLGKKRAGSSPREQCRLGFKNKFPN
jgi:hypothetical protein